MDLIDYQLATSPLFFLKSLMGFLTLQEIFDS